MKIIEIIKEPLPLIGPHQNVELELMLLNKKPLALIPLYLMAEFYPYLSSGRFVSKRFNTLGREPEYAIAQPDQEWRISKLIAIYGRIRQKINSGITPPMAMNNTDHVEIGKLLGYTDAQINAFINRHKKQASL
jgi:hypothetical protein